jgi:hypothetical protein
MSDTDRYVLTDKAERLLDKLSGTEKAVRVSGEGPRAATPSRPSHQMFTNTLRCPGCGSHGFVSDMCEFGDGWRWSFRCTDRCVDRTYFVAEVKP